MKRRVSLELQLPVKCGSGGFRWASFRPGCFSAWQEIARSPPLRVASYVSGQFIATWNSFGFRQIFKIDCSVAWEIFGVRQGWAVWEIFEILDFKFSALTGSRILREPNSLRKLVFRSVRFDRFSLFERQFRLKRSFSTWQSLQLETFSRTKVFNFVDSSAENLVEIILQFDSEFVDWQRLLVIYKKEKICKCFKWPKTEPLTFSWIAEIPWIKNPITRKG